MPIHASVGSKAHNNKNDVVYVQILLNDWRLRNSLSAIKVDGLVGPKTISAILDFQKKFTAYSDGRVDPNGPTLRGLEESYVQAVLNGDWNLKLVKFVGSARKPSAPVAQRLSEEYFRQLRRGLG